MSKTFLYNKINKYHPSSKYALIPNPIIFTTTSVAKIDKKILSNKSNTANISGSSIKNAVIIVQQLKSTIPNITIEKCYLFNIKIK